MASQHYNRIKVVLAEKRITNKELAEDLKVKPQTVSNWCRNVRQPSIRQLFAIARQLNLEAKDLLSSVRDL